MLVARDCKRLGGTPFEMSCLPFLPYSLNDDKEDTEGMKKKKELKQHKKNSNKTLIERMNFPFLVLFYCTYH